MLFRPEHPLTTTELPDGTKIEGSWTPLTKEHFFATQRQCGMNEGEIAALWEKDYGTS